MKPILVAACALVSIAALPAMAQPAAAPARPNALVEFPAKGDAKLTVTTPAWQNGSDIPYENTQYRGNVFPGLAWTAGPASTRSYVVIMQDTGAVVRGAPILHWTLYNIPASVTKLDAGMSAAGNPPGSSYGPNIRAAEQPSSLIWARAPLLAPSTLIIFRCSPWTPRSRQTLPSPMTD